MSKSTLISGDKIRPRLKVDVRNIDTFCSEIDVLAPVSLQDPQERGKVVIKNILDVFGGLEKITPVLARWRGPNIVTSEGSVYEHVLAHYAKNQTHLTVTEICRPGNGILTGLRIIISDPDRTACEKYRESITAVLDSQKSGVFRDLKYRTDLR
jgi:hypothetical protein